ncbi:Anamorsin-like protein [Zea mays]|uniref:Anamorsin-like protein n=1 Tax=Zea mays TaxID=4577 RepID=A0A1D6DTM3_MAIZE|nr:Anamorsin-like protein [Zea mays]
MALDSMSAALAVTDEVALPIRAVGDLAAAAEVSREEVAVITQCAALGGKLPFEDASVGAVLAVIKNVESLREQLVAEISRVLKAGGRVLVQSPAPSSSQKPNTEIERKLLMGGFAEVQSSAANSQDSVQSVTVKAKKASWSMGSSFPLKKTTKALPKIQIDDDSDLIDEDSLLTEEDLKKPQLPVVGDCEVGAAKKACKNCTCGRAEAEEKVGKLELTAEQINNPQSACGSVSIAYSVGWVMPSAVEPVPTEVFHHSSLARRFPCLATSLLLTYDGDASEHRQNKETGVTYVVSRVNCIPNSFC